jgi:F-type H+-transporting ATPase subunit gamma
MAAGKEIRGKIKSVENTKKITKAMEMVAASKMRKAQERMRAARPYSEKIRQVAANLGQANPEYTHAFMKTNEVKAAGFILVTTDKGLCGGMNTNVLRALTTKLREHQADGVGIEAVAIGNKGLGFLNRIGARVVSHVTQLGDTPHLDKLIGPVKVLLDAYAEGKLSAVYLCYTKFINTMKQESVVEQLLPLAADSMKVEAGQMSWDYIYEPDAASVIDELLVRYVESLVYLRGHVLGHRQRRQRDQRAETGLQQDPSGRHHEGTVGNRFGRRSGRRRLSPRRPQPDSKINWSR